MFHWQLIVLFILFLTTINIVWSTGDDATKACIHFTGAPGGEKKCDTYCKGKGKPGGCCVQKRCVCKPKPPKEEEKPETQQQSSNFTIPNRTVNCKAGGTKACQSSCKKIGNKDGACLNGSCYCSKK